MKKYTILFILSTFAFLGSSTFSQNIVYYEQATIVSEKPKKCPNCAMFGHFYSSWGIAIPGNNTNAAIKPLQSSNFSVGYRQIFRINQYIATGFTADINRNYFGIVQKNGKNVHDSILHRKESFQISHADASWFVRIQFQKRRGMHIGNFIDLGGFAGYNLTKTRFTENIDPFGIKQRTWQRNILYINDFQYGLNARISINRYVVVAKYRLSEIFDTNTGFSQLPPLSIGFEIGIHK